MNVFLSHSLQVACQLNYLQIYPMNYLYHFHLLGFSNVDSMTNLSHLPIDSK